MKIACVRRGFAATGGAEAYLRRFAEAAVAAGHTCTLLTGQAWPAEAWPGAIARVAGEDEPLAFARAVREATAGGGFDRVFSCERILECDLLRAGDGVHAAWLARRRRFEPPWRAWWRRWQRKHRALLALEEALYRRRGAGRVIANSRMVKAEIVQHFGYPADRIEVVYNGLPAPPNQPDARAGVRRELGLAEGDFVALFVGSDFHRKGLRYAIDAVRHVDGTTLLVAGRGHAGEGGSVRLLGPRSDVPRLLAAADVFLLPTIYDPFSNASLEALAAGLPVITTAANGCAEILTPGLHGEIIAQPDDVLALAAALRSWSPPERRAATRAARLARGAEFSIERNVSETFAALMKP